MTPDEIAQLSDESVPDVQVRFETVLARGMLGAVAAWQENREFHMVQHQAELAEALKTAAERATLAIGPVILETLRKADDSLFDQVVQEYIEAYGGQKIVNIGSTTLRQIQALIAAEAAEGSSVDEIARLMFERIPQIARTRAAIIARTETHSASQFSSMRVARTINRPLMKTWNSVSDHRTRDFVDPVAEFDHRNMNGVSVAMDEPFRVSKKDGTYEPLMFPGDPAGSPGNIIQCRCVTTYKVAR